jgi:hypothetical protein
MASQSPRLINFVSGALTGCVFGLTITLLPLFAIEHRKLFVFLMHEPDWLIANQVVTILSVTFAFALSFASKNKQILTVSRNTLKANTFQLTATLFLFLYVACAYLCTRLHVAQLPTGLVSQHIWTDFGVVLTFMSALISLVTSINRALRPDQAPRLEHPYFFTGLLYLLGTALSFTTWFPLLAIPGAAVTIIWYMDRATVRDANCRWRLVPYIY